MEELLSEEHMLPLVNYLQVCKKFNQTWSLQQEFIPLKTFLNI